MGLQEVFHIRMCRKGLTLGGNSRPFCRAGWNLRFRIGLLCAVCLTGCGNTCFLFTSNSSTGTIKINASDPSPACRFKTANGAVRVQLAAEPACSTCAGQARVQHIFVSIQSIEVHPSPAAESDSPGWQELLPSEFAKQPLQADLIRDRAGLNAREPSGGTLAIPAGVYRQVRLRFAPNQQAAEDRLPERSACGSAGFNCVVMADGPILPLQFNGSSPELRITPGGMESGFLLIPPETTTDLLIELKPVWGWFSSAEEGVHLLPVLSGSAKAVRAGPGELGVSAREGDD